jgi:small subunit ribosomal protein S20
VAHHKSAKKRIRQTITRTALNKSQTSKVRSVIKAFNTAISETNKELATTKLLEVQSLMRKLAKKGVIKLAQASRKTSRLQKQVNAL